MTNNLPVIANNLIPTDHEMQVFQIMARQSAASGFYGSLGGEPQIFAILLMARELGISPMLALSGGIWNIKGKIEISARLMATLIRRAGHSLQIKELNDEICTVIGKRRDNSDFGEASFTFEEAKRAGLVRPEGNWNKYRQDMLYARAVSRIGRRLFSDCIGTCYVEGEIRDAECEIMPSIPDIEQKTEVTEEEKVNNFKDSLEDCDKEIFEDYLNEFVKNYKVSKSSAVSKFDSKREEFSKHFYDWKNAKSK